MRSLRISHTIYLLLGAALLAGGTSSTYLMFRGAGVSDTYTAIIHGEIAQAQKVRVLQVNFKKQVQAWKDILLRGKDDASLAKYDAEFHTLAQKVDTDGAALSTKITDPKVHAELDNFLQQHQMLDSQFETALADFKTSRDFTQADAAVKGKDRPPTDSLDHVAEQLTVMAETVPAEEASRLRREQGWLATGLSLLWLALGVWSVFFTRSLGIRMQSCVDWVRQISGGDLTVGNPEEGKDDELGELVLAMGQMRDRLHEMMGQIQTVASTLSLSASNISSASRDCRRRGRTAQSGDPGQCCPRRDDCQRSRSHQSLSTSRRASHSNRQSRRRELSYS